MYILLAAATEMEIQATADFLKKANNRLDNHDVSILITGIGSLRTAFALAQSIAARRPDIAFQAGVGGGFANLEIGTVLAVEEDILADLGVWENDQFKSIFDMKLSEPDEKPFTGGKLINHDPALFSIAPLKKGRAITVNEITTSQRRLHWYEHFWSPDVESMEGGAFHYVCLQESIRFLQIRSLSNAVGERDKKKWDMGKAISRLNLELMAILENLKGISASSKFPP